MEIGMFGGADYQHPDMPPGWPRPPRYWDPALARQALQDGMEMYRLADELGLNFVTVSEHHGGGPGLAPNPHVVAAALAPQLTNARIALLGPNVPMNNPVRIAEEVAMLDLLSGGRLYGVALLRGTPNEYLTSAANPAESRAAWEEGVQLILRAWQEPEPFGWEGVHWRFRTIAVWPRFLDPAGPRVLLSGNSPDSVDFAVSAGCDLAISYGGPEQVAQSIGQFRAGCAAAGRAAGPGSVLYRNFVYVAESEERAREECARYGFGSMTQFRPATPGAARAWGEIGAAAYSGPGVMAGLLRKHGGWGLPPFLGTPDQVYEAVRGYHALGVGAIDFSFGGFGLPAELARRNLQMFCRDVLPAVHQLPAAVQAAAGAGA